MKILIIEDEEGIADSIRRYLEELSYLCEQAYTVKQAMNKIIGFEYDCVLLDISLPDGAGFKVLKELKKKNRKEGVIVVSAKDSLEDKIKGLEIGADDYMTKPFHLSELAARIFSVIRRRNYKSVNTVLENEIKIDLLSKAVFVDKKELELTKKELDLLLFFIGNKGRLLSKGMLAEHLSGDFYGEESSEGVVYAHIKNLKKKLKKAGCRSYIKNVYGTGYKWAEE